MARIRTIKPEFWTDERLTECSLSARLLFIGMWNFSDDYGNLERSAKQLKMRIFPADNVDVEALVQELVSQSLIWEYESEGQKYLHIKGFTKHQRINRPSNPSHPLHDDSLSTHGGGNEGSPPEGKGREGKGEEGNGDEPRRDAGASDESTKEYIWRAGVALLTRVGNSEQSARSMIGKWAKKYGEDAVAAAVGRAFVAQPAEPKAWLTAALENNHEDEGWWE